MASCGSSVFFLRSVARRIRLCVCVPGALREVSPLPMPPPKRVRRFDLVPSMKDTQSQQIFPFRFMSVVTFQVLSL